LLNVLQGKRRRFGPSQPATEKDGQHPAVAQSLLSGDIRSIPQRLCLLDREPISDADTIHRNALDAGDSGCQFGREESVVCSLDRQPL
jgi:hypothetical protein